MNTKKTFETVAKIGAFGLGWTVSSMVYAIAKPKGFVDHTLTTIGAMGITFIVGAKFADTYARVFGGELSEADNDENV